MDILTYSNPLISWAFAHPFTRLQIHFQTTHTNSGAHFSKDLKNFYKGGSASLLRMPFVFLGPIGHAISYPLEVQQIKANYAGSNYEINWKNFAQNLTCKSNWVGFTGLLGWYFALYSSTIFGVFSVVAMIPIDNVRRNFVVQNLEEGKSVSYNQVFKEIVAKEGYKGLMRGWMYYPFIYAVFLVAFTGAKPVLKKEIEATA